MNVKGSPPAMLRGIPTLGWRRMGLQPPWMQSKIGSGGSRGMTAPMANHPVAVRMQITAASLSDIFPPAVLGARQPCVKTASGSPRNAMCQSRVPTPSGPRQRCENSRLISGKAGIQALFGDRWRKSSLSFSRKSSGSSVNSGPCRGIHTPMLVCHQISEQNTQGHEFARRPRQNLPMCGRETKSASLDTTRKNCAFHFISTKVEINVATTQ
ncbi:hypothetical protein ROLI_030690 [Roseobacter fucihabitans]|uniref:Uncharacterized protein n=1 Tax=Roseobacter fucihabitans TaxID=1537242 RepID=A0ABZ2BX75_9RHOB|nr:hypothetical protein [Roseobacter litoralis]